MMAESTSKKGQVQPEQRDYPQSPNASLKPDEPFQVTITLQDDESEDLIADGRKVFGQKWEEWLDTPQVEWLGGNTPRSLIGTPDEWLLRMTIRERKYPWGK